MKVRLVWALTSLLWSSLWLFIKLGLRDLPPVSFAGLRLAVALAVLLPLASARGGGLLPRGRRDLLLTAATGLLLLGLNYALVFWGTRHVSSGLAAVLQASTPLFGLLFARRFLPGERFGARGFAATALGVAGVAVIFSDQLGLAGWPGLWGSAAVVGGALSVALAYVLVKAYGSHLDPVSLAAGQMLVSAVPLLAFGAAFEGNPLTFRWSTAAVASLLYLALVGSVVAFRLNYWLLKRMDSTSVMLIAVVEPLGAALLGAAVLGERLTGNMLAGGACVLLGVALSASRGAAPEDVGLDAPRVRSLEQT